jgi:hypothetical protein
MESTMTTLINNLAHQASEVRKLKVYCAFLTLASISLVFVAFKFQRPDDDVIRTKGIIITDKNGKERILIGAPVPGSVDRIRSDFEKAKNAWGKRFPSFDWYKSLNNATNGMIIIDESGYDRIAIGDPVPDPNIGKRIASSVGIAINDNEGFERSGWGFFPEKNRIVLGLDSPNGSEGIILSILEDGSTGMSVMSGKNTAYIGSAPANGMITELPEALNGLLIRDSSGTKYKLNAFEKK